MASSTVVNEGVTHGLVKCDIPAAAATQLDTGGCSSTKCIDPMFIYPVGIGVNNQLISVFSNSDVSNAMDIHSNGWPQPDQCVKFFVTVQESIGVRKESFIVSNECFLGSCACKYSLDGLLVSMKPCPGIHRMFPVGGSGHELVVYIRRRGVWV